MTRTGRDAFTVDVEITHHDNPDGTKHVRIRRGAMTVALPDPDGRTVQTIDDWRDQATDLFGPRPENWAFVCPNCGDIATVADFRPDSTHRAGSECIGRITPDRGCDWTANGLIAGPTAVTFPDGGFTFAFRFGPARSTSTPMWRHHTTPRPDTQRAGPAVSTRMTDYTVRRVLAAYRNGGTDRATTQALNLLRDAVNVEGPRWPDKTIADIARGVIAGLDAIAAEHNAVEQLASLGVTTSAPAETPAPATPAAILRDGIIGHAPYIDGASITCGYTAGQDVVGGCGHPWPCPQVRVVADRVRALDNGGTATTATHTVAGPGEALR